MSKPNTPKGTRDFGPLEMGRRNYIFDTIKKTFQLYGFAPIETPAMELTETLMGKYGEEGDRLIFRILNSGDYVDNKGIIENGWMDKSLRSALNAFSTDGKWKAMPFNQLDLLSFFWNILNNPEYVPTDKGLRDYYDMLDSKSLIADAKINYDRFKNGFTNEIAEKALRYDLTVPFARFVVQHQNEISFPFKRYQIQPVWRADRPQKGRYREFYQCDADVVGSDSLLFEVDFIQIFAIVLANLQVPGFAIKINNRKVLSGIAEVIGEKDKMVDITVAIDKLDKIGKEGVNKELNEKGVAEAAIQKLQPLIDFTGSNTEKLSFLKTYLEGSEIGQKGIEELEYIFAKVEKFSPELLVEGAEQNLELDITLARGLNYYTGAIFEVKAKGVSMGSICGGGRYDDLTGIFGLKGMSGVGISFGADRIYDVLEELNLFPETASTATKLLVVHFGEAEAEFGLGVVHQVRKAGISAELYPDQVKMKKQMTYANDKKVPFVAIVGGDELAAGKVMLKNMHSGEQQLVTQQELIKALA